MSYLAFCTFDLKTATSEDYKNAYADLEAIGLKKVVASSDGNRVVLPTTAAMGEITGDGAASVRDHVRSSVQKVFKARGVRSEVFVVVGGDWAWRSGTT